MLDGKHAKITCEGCHTQPAPAGKAAAAVGTNCIGCHRRDDVHDGAFGPGCEQCHGTDDWKRVRTRTGLLESKRLALAWTLGHSSLLTVGAAWGGSAMRRLTHFRAAYHRVTVWFAALMLACLAAGAGLTFAQTTISRNFDHLKTGFALTGAHIQTRCESCHLNGLFQGTPRDCASCHVSGTRYSRGNVVRPANHLPTTQACSICHNTKTYVGTTFNHQGVTAGTCSTCHNGTSGATGKPANHIQTSASCDTCHRITAWLPASKFDHAGVVAGTCTSCHGTGKATGKSPTHMPTNANQSCDDCHKNFAAGGRPRGTTRRWR